MPSRRRRTVIEPGYGAGMNNTIHHLPGRLRMRMEVLRRNPCAVASARRSIKAVAGVRAVEARQLTGSLLVHYDPNLTSAKAILDALAEGGFNPPRQHACPASRTASGRRRNRSASPPGGGRRIPPLFPGRAH